MYTEPRGRLRLRYWPRFSQLAQLALDLLLDVERLLALAHAALVAGDHELAHLLAQLVVAEGGETAARGQQLLDLGVDVDRLPPLATPRSERAWTIWRISSSRTSAETGAMARRSPPERRRARSAKSPLPISVDALLAPSANTIPAPIGQRGEHDQMRIVSRADLCDQRHANRVSVPFGTG